SVRRDAHPTPPWLRSRRLHAGRRGRRGDLERREAAVAGAGAAAAPAGAAEPPLPGDAVAARAGRETERAAETLEGEPAHQRGDAVAFVQRDHGATANETDVPQPLRMTTEQDIGVPSERWQRGIRIPRDRQCSGRDEIRLV